MMKHQASPIQLSLPTPLAVGPVNAYLLPGDEPALVDVGPRDEQAWEALRCGLIASGVPPQALRHVFITHAHVDHYGGAARLAEAAPQATFYAAALAHARPTLLDSEEEWERHHHFAEVALLASGVPPEIAAQNRLQLKRLRTLGSAVPVARWVEPGERLRLGAHEWEVVALPGHSMTQVGLRRSEEQWFIAADHLLPHISSNALLEPPAPGERRRPRALPRYVETLRWMSDLPPHQIFPGHGDPFFDQRPLIARRLAGVEERAALLLNALRGGPQSVIQLVRYLFPKLGEGQLFLAISEVVGHLDVLEARGQVSFRGQPVREYFVRQ